MIWVLPGFLLLTAGTYFLVPEPTHQSNEERFEFAQQYKEGVDACSIYAQLIAADPHNSQYQFAFAQAWSRANKKSRTFLKNELQQAGQYPNDQYEQAAKSTDPAVRNSGLFGLACDTYYNEQPTTAGKFLDSISDTSFPGRELLYGLIAEKWLKRGEACIHYQSEISNNGLMILAWKKVARCGYTVAVDPESGEVLHELSEYIPPHWLRHRLWQEGDIGGYLLTVPNSFSSRSDLLGTFAAFLVMLVWLFFLLKLGRLGQFSSVLGIGALLGGILSAYPITIAYDLSHWVLDIWMNGSLSNKLFAAVWQIGLIEEIGKLLPVIILALAFRKHFQSPLDYVLVAALSGLGFTFIEDSVYFTDTSLDIISSRSLITGVLHMAWTSLAIYGFVQFKFRKANWKTALGVVGYPLLAILLHGLYDFWAMNNSYGLWLFLPLLIIFLSILVWVNLLNHSLNNSNAYENRDQLDISRLNMQLIALFSSIVFIEYFVNTWVHGPSQSLGILWNSVQVGLYCIPFLAFRLSNIDIAPGGWGNIDLSLHKSAQDLTKILEQRFRLTPFRDFGVIAQLLPMEGTITERITLKNDHDWFIFLPDQRYVAKFKNVAALLIKPKESGTSLLGKDVMVHVRLVNQLADLKNPTGDLKKFRFIDWAEMNELTPKDPTVIQPNP